MRSLEPIIEAVLLALFISSVLAYGYLTKGLGPYSVRGVVRSSKVAETTLSAFLQSGGESRHSRQVFAFQEQNVTSIARSIVGRPDLVYLHLDDAPVLDLVVERKFTERFLPDNANPEDVFQASLYALALMDSGVSCSRTRLLVVYCTQGQGEACMQNKSRSCYSCRRGRHFCARFSQKDTLRRLAKLDEIWYRGRKPRPASSPSVCRRCPYSTDGSCNHASL